MAILRTYTRFVVEDLDKSLSVFEALTGSSALRLDYGDWRTGVVGGFLLVWIPQGQAPDYTVHALCAVDDLEEALRLVTSHGATCIAEPKDVSTGRNFIARHADGLVIEYLQPHPEFTALLTQTPNAAEAAASGPTD